MTIAEKADYYGKQDKKALTSFCFALCCLQYITKDGGGLFRHFLQTFALRKLFRTKNEQVYFDKEGEDLHFGLKSLHLCNEEMYSGTANTGRF
ncbi:hypothetical protein C2I18_21290 [Paenibacillus sp. PK3_47]|uniref:hypothetical protein n=1 Tax=Paenibacillus sp. PK3_47 TaxID=2072642 RepID=UPI00201D419A|nr:hypothetical protein [Paenibacillus sp. PK3_47]UQZ35841.1 hypothetical protein C2I18_21290 [Paenibacillus sp. PK3_47]